MDCRWQSKPTKKKKKGKNKPPSLPQLRAFLVIGIGHGGHVIPLCIAVVRCEGVDVEDGLQHNGTDRVAPQCVGNFFTNAIAKLIETSPVGDNITVLVKMKAVEEGFCLSKTVASGEEGGNMRVHCGAQGRISCCTSLLEVCECSSKGVVHDAAAAALDSKNGGRGR